MDSLLGKILKNHYRIDEFLGRGGIAAVILFISILGGGEGLKKESNYSYDSIKEGDCAYLNWEVGNAHTVYFGQRIILNSDFESICPRDTTTYTLIADWLSGKQYSKSVMVNIYRKNSVKPTSTPALKTCIGYGKDEGINVRKNAGGMIIGCCLGTGMKVTIYEVNPIGKWARIKSEKGHAG